MKETLEWISLAILLVLLGFSGTALSEASIDVRVPLPPLLFPAPPQTVIIPNTNVYFCPDAETDVFFYHGYWYRPHEGRWYRADNYDGRWVYIRDVPRALIGLPPDFRRIAIEHRRIPYADLHRNWISWEKDRYWERHDWGRGEEREERHAHERGEREGYHHETY